jgi:threonyl-tRNA synthetase
MLLKALAKDLARNVISASFNGTTVETTTPLTTDGVLYYIHGMMKMERKRFGILLRTLWRRLLEELYPGIKLTLGPAIAMVFIMM